MGRTGDACATVCAGTGTTTPSLPPAAETEGATAGAGLVFVLGFVLGFGGVAVPLDAEGDAFCAWVLGAWTRNARESRDRTFAERKEDPMGRAIYHDSGAIQPSFNESKTARHTNATHKR